MLDSKPHWGRENEREDSAEKLAIYLTLDKFRVPYADMKPKINKFLHAKWQQRWNDNIHNKLIQIQTILGEWRQGFRK